MRVPQVLLGEGTDPKSHKRRSISFLPHSPGTADKHAVQTLKWVFCGFESGWVISSYLAKHLSLYCAPSDSTPQLRLLVSYRSGAGNVFTITRDSSSSAWHVEKELKTIEGAEHPLPRASFVINSKTGASCAANRASLAGDVRPGPQGPHGSDDPHCFWISAGAKSVRSIANLAGHRVGKAEWGKGKTVETVEVVSKNGRPTTQIIFGAVRAEWWYVLPGSHVLVAIMATREALIYTLPALELLYTFHLPFVPNSCVHTAPFHSHYKPPGHA